MGRAMVTAWLAACAGVMTVRRNAAVKHMDFFYFFGSGYAYLSVMRIAAMAEAAGVTVRWRPINVRPLMKENNVALRTEALKVKYLWRDIERRAATHGIPFVKPPIWTTDPDLVHNRVGIVAAEGGWCEPFTVASFKAWYLDGMALGDRACLEHVLKPLGKDVDAVLAEAASDRIQEIYDRETEAARSHGVFGSPSFVVDGEMFWGDDRLEEALAWATGTHRLQTGK
jgi:2-hydroxychromene-2-carboxylate isomerase